jgi:hypothetical protein
VRAHDELSCAAVEVLRRAKEDGYALWDSEDGTQTSIRKGNTKVLFTSNEEIEDFGRTQRWIS